MGVSGSRGLVKVVGCNFLLFCFFEVFATKSKQGTEQTRTFDPTNRSADCWSANGNVFKKADKLSATKCEHSHWSSQLIFLKLTNELINQSSDLREAFK